MNVTSNCHEAAACALYSEMKEKVPYSSCQKLTSFVDNFPQEMPMGVSEKEWRKSLVRQTRSHAVSTGILSGGILMWLIQSGVLKAIELLVRHWIANKGWNSPK